MPNQSSTGGATTTRTAISGAFHNVFIGAAVEAALFIFLNAGPMAVEAPAKKGRHNILRRAGCFLDSAYLMRAHKPSTEHRSSCEKCHAAPKPAVAVPWECISLRHRQKVAIYEVVREWLTIDHSFVRSSRTEHRVA